MKVPVPMIGGSGSVTAAVVLAVLLGIAVFATRNSNPIVAAKTY